MAGYFRITDGTTTYDLLDGNPYALDLNGYWPSIAPLDDSILGGKPHYKDVKETMSVRVKSSTSAGIVSALRNLAAMIDQASRQQAGDDVSAIRLLAGSGGSADWQCLILEGDSSDLLKTASKYSLWIHTGHFGNQSEYSAVVKVPIKRRGWIKNAAADTVESTNGLSTSNVTQVMQFDAYASAAGQADMIHPVDITLTVKNGSSNYLNKSAGYFVVCSAVAMIDVKIPTVSLNQIVGWTNPTENTAWVNTIYKAANTTGEKLLRFTWASNRNRRYHVFIKWRNPDNAINYTARLYQAGVIQPPSSPFGAGELGRFYCPANTDDPQITYLGVIAFDPSYAYQSAFGFTPDGTATDGLEVESVLLVADETDTNIFKIDDLGQVEYDPAPDPIYGGEQVIEIKPRAATHPRPILAIDNDENFDGVYPVVTGDLYPGLRGEAPAAILYCTGYGGAWNTGDGNPASGNTTQINVTIGRYEATQLP